VLPRSPSTLHYKCRSRNLRTSWRDTNGIRNSPAWFFFVRKPSSRFDYYFSTSWNPSEFSKGGFWCPTSTQTTLSSATPIFSPPVPPPGYSSLVAEAAVWRPFQNVRGKMNLAENRGALISSIILKTPVSTSLNSTIRMVSWFSKPQNWFKHNEITQIFESCK